MRGWWSTGPLSYAWINFGAICLTQIRWRSLVSKKGQRICFNSCLVRYLIMLCLSKATRYLWPRQKGFCPFGCLQAFRFRAVGTLRRLVAWKRIAKRWPKMGNNGYFSFPFLSLTKQSQLNGRGKSLMCQESIPRAKYIPEQVLFMRLQEDLCMTLWANDILQRKRKRKLQCRPKGLKVGTIDELWNGY